MADFKSSAKLSPEQAKVLASLTPAQLRGVLATVRTVRKRSSHEFLGMPLYSVATGPDPLRGEPRGHARGVVAIGDIATGIIAIGGWARGIVAMGGLATGLLTFGGASLGLATAVGGAAIGTGISIGGLAVGQIAVGGVAAGRFAAGGVAVGMHVIDVRSQDPEAVAFLARHGVGLPHGWARR